MNKRVGIGAPYDDMAERVYDGCLRLMEQARAGSRLGVLAEARALRGQVAALAELLGMREAVAPGRGGAPVPFEPHVLPVPAERLTERRGN